MKARCTMPKSQPQSSLTRNTCFCRGLWAQRNSPKVPTYVTSAPRRVCATICSGRLNSAHNLPPQITHFLQGNILGSWWVGPRSRVHTDASKTGQNPKVPGSVLEAGLRLSPSNIVLTMPQILTKTFSGMKIMFTRRLSSERGGHPATRTR